MDLFQLLTILIAVVWNVFILASLVERKTDIKELETEISQLKRENELIFKSLQR